RSQPFDSQERNGPAHDDGHDRHHDHPPPRRHPAQSHGHGPGDGKCKGSLLAASLFPVREISSSRFGAYVLTPSRAISPSRISQLAEPINTPQSPHPHGTPGPGIDMRW